MLGGHSPYRTSTVAAGISERAPALVRVAALTGIVLGTVAVPGVTYFISTLESDGIAVSLFPPVVCAVAVWVSGWLLLARARVAVDVARTSAVATMAAHLALVSLAAIHVLAARLGWSDRPSIAYVFLALTFAVVAVPQAALLRAAADRLQRGG
jgi:hypothetical protein